MYIGTWYHFNAIEIYAQFSIYFNSTMHLWDHRFSYRMLRHITNTHTCSRAHLSIRILSIKISCFRQSAVFLSKKFKGRSYEGFVKYIAFFIFRTKFSSYFLFIVNSLLLFCSFVSRLPGINTNFTVRTIERNGQWNQKRNPIPAKFSGFTNFECMNICVYEQIRRVTDINHYIVSF